MRVFFGELANVRIYRMNMQKRYITLLRWQKWQHHMAVFRNIEAEKEFATPEIGEDDSYLKTFFKHQNIKTLDRGLLVELVDTIYIHENKENTVKFDFTDR